MLHKCRVFFNEHCMTAAAKCMFNQTDLSCKNPLPAAIKQKCGQALCLAQARVPRHFSKLEQNKKARSICIYLYFIDLSLYVCSLDYITIPLSNREGKDPLTAWLDVMAVWQGYVYLLQFCLAMPGTRVLALYILCFTSFPQLWVCEISLAAASLVLPPKQTRLK